VTELQQNFVQEDIVMKYFNIEDMLTKIGGITATINIALGFLGLYFMVQFHFAICEVIHRKEKETLRLFEIKIMKKQMPLVEKTIKDLIKDGG